MRIPTKSATESEVNRPGNPSQIGHRAGAAGGGMDYALAGSVLATDWVLRRRIESPARLSR